MKNLKRFVVVTTLCAATQAFGAPATTESIIDPNQTPNAAPRASNEGNELGVITHLGLQLATNTNSVTATSDSLRPDASGRTRMMYGVNAQIGLAGIFYAQPELNYVQRGFTETRIQSGTRTDLEIGMNYLELPLLVKIMPELGSRKVRPFALVGPSLALNLSTSAIESQRDQNGQVSVQSLPFREEGFSTFALSMHFGLGAQFELTDAISAIAGLRYVAGLTNLASSGGTSVIKANLFQVLGGVQVAL